MAKRDPVNPTTDEARALAGDLLRHARYGAIAVNHPETRAPYAARVALLWHDKAMLTLISTLSLHTRALQADPACAALIGEPGDKGDPLTHPRMTLICTAREVDKAAMKDPWLAAIPKAQLYYDFSDFKVYALDVAEAHLNGGFGKAFVLGAGDLHL